MFQFRRFPAYAYLIQRTLHGYCPCGLPHSEIHGSMDICSSPWLIAACRVLRRLLMPRHSPCALLSLTCRRGNSLHSVSGQSLRLRPETPYPLLPSPPSAKTGFRRFCTGDGGRGDVGRGFVSRLVREIGSLKNYAGFEILEIVIVTLRPLGRCSTIKTCCCVSTASSLLPYFTLHTLFSFQGTKPRRHSGGSDGSGFS